MWLKGVAWGVGVWGKPHRMGVCYSWWALSVPPAHSQWHPAATWHGPPMRGMPSMPALCAAPCGCMMPHMPHTPTHHAPLQPHPDAHSPRGSLQPCGMPTPMACSQQVLPCGPCVGWGMQTWASRCRMVGGVEQGWRQSSREGG